MIRAFLEKVGLLAKKKVFGSPAANSHSPLIIPRKEHSISRSAISDNALKVLYRLHHHGYQAYLVGGGVRDLLLGLHPKDFDVVTNAHPEEIKRVFRNCRLIGRRFRLAHIYFGHDIIEVATFRKIADTPSDELAHSDSGMILRDNVYGTLEEDVWRRDFTINALYYNIADFSLVDFTGGYADLKAKKLRMIGDVAQRYREDPVRMLRAIRFACKVGFEVPPDLTSPMKELKELLQHVSSARLFEEILKMFHSGGALAAYQLLKKYHLFEQLFPETAACLAERHYPTDALLTAVFRNTDNRLKEQKTVTPAFIIAALLWHPICQQTDMYLAEGMPFFPAKLQAIEELLKKQAKRLSVPKRLVQGARDIWLLQIRLKKRQGKRAQLLMEEPKFRAAYDFLELRAEVGEEAAELAKWWREYIVGDATVRKNLLKEIGGEKKKRHTFRKKRAKVPKGD